MIISNQFDFLAKQEDSIVKLLDELGGTAFSDNIGSIKNSPTYVYLKKFYWHSPAVEEYWDNQFKLAATIMRRLRVKPKYACTILGQTGTGKEIFARAFAAGRKFTAINCTAMPAELLESELFGHVAGSFTGAVGNREGLLVAARDGVAFLDEIGDMPELLQAKLLRALQERVVRPVGSNTEVPIQCTIICATHQKIVERLRDDIRWRLCTYTIRLLPWTERIQEISWVIREKLDPHKLLTATDIQAIQNRFIEAGTVTGNFRELESLVEQCKLRTWLQKV